MIKPTLLLVWPVHIDYPLFRYNLKQYRNFFEDVFICFTNLNQTVNYMEQVKQDLPFASTFKPYYIRPDWRDDAVNSLLSIDTKASHYLFMEQDFLIKDGFFEKVLNSRFDTVLYLEDQRIHPAFALVRREDIKKTGRDFSANPPQHDHFGKFFNEFIELTNWTDLESLADKNSFYHLAGLTQNYSCFKDNQPFYKPSEFLTYNYCTLQIDVFTGFRDVCERINNNSFLWNSNELNETIKSFFPKEVAA